MITKSSSFFLILVILVSLTSCTNQIVFEQNKDFVSEQWHKDSVLVFDVNIKDTTKVYNIYFNTRITGDYNFQNMFLFIDTEMPYDNAIRDTLECILSESSGEPYGKANKNWLGVGLGHIWAYQIGYKTYVKFPFSGDYRIRVQQAMRPIELDNVLDAGITIEAVK